MANVGQDGIVLHPAVAFPIEMYTDERIAEFDAADAALAKRMGDSRAFHLPADVELVEKDKPILAGAIGAGCTHLWTSDRLHFGPFYGTVVHGVRIVSSIQQADTLHERSG